MYISYRLQLRIACDGLLETLGRVDFDGRMSHNFTAHPKIDPITGEMFYFGYAGQRASQLNNLANRKL